MAMRDVPLPIHGRGAGGNPANRFEAAHYEPDPDADEPFSAATGTELIPDNSKTIISENDSPDIGFRFSLNAYRGCEHGCIYCYARPTHETLGYSAGLDFESKIMVKYNAPALLRKKLMDKSWQGEIISMASVTDCYQPVERSLRITRGCLEVLAEFRNPVSIITKNHLITRDIDLLRQLAGHHAVAVFISVTTLQSELIAIMEPRTSSPRRRLAAITELAQAGIPTGVLVAPVIPGLTDEQMPDILKAAAAAGATFAGYTPVRLPYGVKDLFQNWLREHKPDRAEKILNRIRSMRGGKLNDSNFATRMRGEGLFADQIENLFELSARRAGLQTHYPAMSSAAFRRPGTRQLGLFE
jgi:DNA repair photolyase